MKSALIAASVAILAMACGGNSDTEASDDTGGSGDTTGSTATPVECETDAACKLRRGLTCCGCSQGDWVAVSVDYEKATCDTGEPIPCTPCSPSPPPEDIAAMCGADGHCAISTLD